MNTVSEFVLIFKHGHLTELYLLKICVVVNNITSSQLITFLLVVSIESI